MFALEWPLGFVAGSALHRSLEFRLAIIPLTALAAALMYQGTNPALWYMIGMVVYFVAYSEGEVSLCPRAKNKFIANSIRSSVLSLGLCLSVVEPAAIREHKLAISFFLFAHEGMLTEGCNFYTEEVARAQFL